MVKLANDNGSVAADQPPATRRIQDLLTTNGQQRDVAKIFLYVTLLLILVFIGGMLVIGLSQVNNDHTATSAMAKAYFEQCKTRLDFRPDLSLMYMDQSGRAKGTLFLKASAVFLGYVVVLVGCLFVLKGIESYYRLAVAHESVKSALQTSSPGLVLITLGAGLVLFSLYSSSKSESTFIWGGSTPTRASVSDGTASLFSSPTTQEQSHARYEVLPPID